MPSLREMIEVVIHMWQMSSWSLMMSSWSLILVVALFTVDLWVCRLCLSDGKDLFSYLRWISSVPNCLMLMLTFLIRGVCQVFLYGLWRLSHWRSLSSLSSCSCCLSPRRSFSFLSQLLNAHVCFSLAIFVVSFHIAQCSCLFLLGDLCRLFHDWSWYLYHCWSLSFLSQLIMISFSLMIFVFLTADSVLHLSLRYKDRFWLRFPCSFLKSLIIQWDQIKLQEIFENILCKKLPVN